MPDPDEEKKKRNEEIADCVDKKVCQRLKEMEDRLNERMDKKFEELKAAKPDEPKPTGVREVQSLGSEPKKVLIVRK